MTNLGARLIALGLWLCQRPRGPFPRHLLLTGRWAISLLNKAATDAELARRHAKPSSRKRVV
jgi:hypothetical protein